MKPLPGGSVESDLLEKPDHSQAVWPRGPRALLFSFLLAVLIMTLASARIGSQVFRYQDLQMDFDEAIHATGGLDIASAIWRGQPSELWYLTVKPHWYPPAHGFFLGGWLMLLGSSTATVRLYATFCYFLLGLLLWVSAKQAFSRAHPLFYLIPTLFLVSDQQHAIHAGLSMLELPSTLLALASLYFFNQALSRPGYLNHFLAGLCALLCFLTKYNYGLVVLAAEAICYVIVWLPWRTMSGLAQRAKIILLAWLPALILLFSWLFLLGEWRWLVAYSNAQPVHYATWSYENLAFYPRQLSQESSGWLPLILTLAGLFLWTRRREFPKAVLSYLVFFIIAFGMLVYETQDSTRFGMILFPPLWIMSTGGLAILLEQIPIRRLRYLLLSGFLVILAISSLRNLTTIAFRLGIAYENLDAEVNEAYQFIAEIIRVDRSQDLSVVMFGDTDTWNGPALHFYLQSRCRISRSDCMIQVMDEREIKKVLPGQHFPQPERQARMDRALAGADYLVIFSKFRGTPAGWSPVASQEFVFGRRGVRPARRWVTILRPER